MRVQTERELESACKILEENLSQIDRVSEWCEFCGFKNAKKFSRQFRNRYCIRPKKKMNPIKIKKAIELLAEGMASNYEIALEVGKKDEKALNTFFKQQTGNPPEFYRRKK